MVSSGHWSQVQMLKSATFSRRLSASAISLEASFATSEERPLASSKTSRKASSVRSSLRSGSSALPWKMARMGPGAGASWS